MSWKFLTKLNRKRHILRALIGTCLQKKQKLELTPLPLFENWAPLQGIKGWGDGHLLPSLSLTLYVPEGVDLPTLMQIPNFLKIALYKPILRFVDFSCISITVLLHKTRASFVPQFTYGWLFFNKKFVVLITRVQKISIFAKNNDFSKRSQGYSFQVRGLCF